MRFNDERGQNDETRHLRVREALLHSLMVHDMRNTVEDDTAPPVCVTFARISLSTAMIADTMLVKQQPSPSPVTAGAFYVSPSDHHVSRRSITSTSISTAR